MTLSFQLYNLKLKHTFTVASNSRTTTPVVLTQIEYDGIVGYGEASMPPYLGETQGHSLGSSPEAESAASDSRICPP